NNILNNLYKINKKDRRMKIIHIKKRVALMACACTSRLAPQVSAMNLTIADSRYLGLIKPSLPADPTDSAAYIDNLLDLAPSGVTNIVNFPHDNAYTRSANNPLGGSYPDAVVSGVQFGGSVTNIDLGDGYLYLKAFYGAQ